MKKKKCIACEKRKDLSEFHKNASKPDGIHSHCKKCVSDYSKEWYRKKIESGTYVRWYEKGKGYLTNKDKSDRNIAEIRARFRDWCKNGGEFV